VFFRLGLLRYNSADYKGAVGAFEQAVIKDNTYLNARYYLGLSYKKVGRSEDALVQFNILNQLVPDNQEVKSAINSVKNPSQATENEEKSTTSETSKTKPPLEEKQ
jgi:cytochrome c-type biogenesis protein CcmH/NrfG